MSNIQVSVRCVTYNHVGYIAQCLESLVTQKTDFDYEVLVFDDASNDGTSDIVRMYAERYPDIVVPIIRTQNCYSRGLSADYNFLDYAKGRFIAVCEGDDYWCCESKLQQQFDYMALHPECLLLCSGVAEYDDTKQRIVSVRRAADAESNVKLERILFNFTSFGTNSMMYRRESHNLPEAFTGWGVGDYPRFIYSSIMGVVHYLPEVMSVYRINVPGSWTARNKDLSTKKKSTVMISKGLKAADQYSSFRYHYLFERAVYLQKRDYLLAAKDWRELTAGETALFFRNDSLKMKMIAWMRCFLPDSVVRILIDIDKVVAKHGVDKFSAKTQ